MEDPQVTKGFKTKPWSNDLDDLGYPPLEKGPIPPLFFGDDMLHPTKCRGQYVTLITGNNGNITHRIHVCFIW